MGIDSLVAKLVSENISHWQYRDTLLICADCLRVLPWIEAGSVDCVVCDPPYGHTENGSLQQRREAVLGWKDGVGIYRDDAHHDRIISNDGAEANEIFRRVLLEWNRILKPGCCCCCCCCGGGGPDPQFARWSLWIDEAIGFKQMVVWDKGPMGMGWHYRRSYETVLVGEKPGAACHWFSESADVENIIRPGDYGIRKIIPQSDDHPTPKPIQLAAHFIKLHSTNRDIVLDSFCGYGWVGIACARLGRRFIGIELDEAFYVEAKRRIEEAYADSALFDNLEPPPQQTELEFTP